jgi:creatinine amidohydrolase
MATSPKPEVDVTRPLRLKEMIPHEVADALRADSRLIIPVGTCEHHGPHLPLGCDTIVVETLADEFSAEFRVLRAPTLEYGVNAQTELMAPGNAPVRRKSLLRILNDLIDAWEAQGVREFILLTGHGHEPHQEALSTVFTHGARVRVIDIYAVGINDLLVSETGPMHGDEADTSVMLYLAPHLVHMERARDYTLVPGKPRQFRRSTFRIPRDSEGSVGRPSLASAAKGEAIYARIRERIRHRVFLTPEPEDK